MIGNKSAKLINHEDATPDTQKQIGKASSITSSQLFQSDGEINEFAHPKAPNLNNINSNMRLPRTYGDLQAEYTV